ncbi:MAG: protein kinase [Bradymonadales bacterium]|nr:protein kinase [Bradymonadales bacterium]
MLRIDPDATSSQTRICPDCGTHLRGDARFCGHCGQKLVQDGKIEASSLVGQIVAGAYRVDEILGTGSMGVVYRAEQIALSRPVALKVIGESTDDETTRARFRREARASSQLGHPNVVQIYDFGQLAGGQPYLAMELLEGKTLEQIINEEFPIPLKRIVVFMTDVLSALQAAHDKGILHRDLKPANVFICTLPDNREIAKVLDFGIATAMDGTQSGSKTWAPLTEAGFVCGTPAFMSPEQVQGLPLDQRSDLFSAAGLMHQMLTQQRPFPGKTPVEVGANIVLKPLQTPSKVRPELNLPVEIDRFLIQAMAKNPEERFATALDMIEALKELSGKLLVRQDSLAATTPTAVKSSPRRPRSGSKSPSQEITLADAIPKQNLDEMSHLVQAETPEDLDSLETLVPAGRRRRRAASEETLNARRDSSDWSAIDVADESPDQDIRSTQQVRRLRLKQQRFWMVLLWSLLALLAIAAGVLTVVLIRR